MRWSSVVVPIFLSALIGNGVFYLWKFGSRILERQGRLRGIRAGLILTIFVYGFPVLLFLGWGNARGLWEREEAPSFWNAPVLALTTGFLFVLWAGGAVLAATDLMKKRKMGRLSGKDRLAGPGIQKMAAGLRKRLRIRKRIPVCMAEGVPGPFITGVWRCRIFLPEKDYTEEELQIILEHELWHYKQGDLLLKSFCTWLAWIEWFNPLLKALFSEVDRWGDIHCDLKMCYRRERPWDKKQYFRVVLDHVPEEKTLFLPEMRLRTDKEELRERMKKMKEYRPDHEFTGPAVFLFLLCVALMTVTVSFAAGKWSGTLYRDAYETLEAMALKGMRIMTRTRGG